MNKIHKDMLDTLQFDNKDFESEAKSLYTEFFERIEYEEKEWDKTHPKPRGLDGGFNGNHLVEEYYNKFCELKKKYHITDK